jgi:hypothetical protein
MKRSELMKVIKETTEDSDLEHGDFAEEFAGDLADRLEEEFGLIDEEENEDDEEEE